MTTHLFDQSGYAILPDMVAPERLQFVDTTQANSRQMLELDWCASLADEVRLKLVAIGLIANDYVAIQCTYFEKSTEHNWLVALHQDLSIPVKARIEHAALSGWSEKDGVLFVQPPPALWNNWSRCACTSTIAALKTVR
ncbi:hypothetical protein [Duganella aquatilis]|uniref:hypothetical protein n=1 Tax=Duganella aquatilis TaxID=2666082 RepID=UPI001AA02B9F|nr:hypothetical protein [Duganella aquatilis]